MSTIRKGLVFFITFVYSLTHWFLCLELFNVKRLYKNSLLYVNKYFHKIKRLEILRLCFFFNENVLRLFKTLVSELCDTDAVQVSPCKQVFDCIVYRCVACSRSSAWPIVSYIILCYFCHSRLLQCFWTSNESLQASNAHFYKIYHIYLIFTMVLWIKWNILLPHYEYNYTSEKVELPNSIYIASKWQTCWYLVCSPAGRI